MRTAGELFEELCALDESTTIEAKAGSRIDRSVLETVCSFSNEPGLGGGHLLLGVVRTEDPASSERYEVVGVDDPDQLQSDLVTRCASAFNRPIRPSARTQQLQGRTVVVVFVPEAAPTDKPIFLEKLGLPRGAFRRLGPTDHEGTEDDLVVLYQGHQQETYDGTVLADSDLSDLDPEALRMYRVLRARVAPAAEELAWSDEDLLRALRCVVPVGGVLRLTVAGVLLFGTSKALRRCFPMMRIDYLRLPGRRWIEDPEKRFDAVEIRAPLILAVSRAVAAVMDDLPASFSLPEGALSRQDETVLPLRVVREVVVNAVMHRSYRIHGAVQILRYANRIEVRNPGHSLKAEEQLGEPGSECRNPRLAGVLHDLQMAESKGSGIRVMRELMREHGLQPPAFESSLRPDQFVATFLFHHFLDARDLSWLRRLTDEPLSDEEARALIFVREVGAIDNDAYRSFGHADTLGASARLRRLRDLGLLEMRGSGSRTYYVPGPALAGATQRALGDGLEESGEAQESNGDRHQSLPDRLQSPGAPHRRPTETHKLHAQNHKLGHETHKLDHETHKLDLPADLRARIAQAGRRPTFQVLRSLVLDLCRAVPMSAREITEALGRKDPRELTRRHLRPMLATGRLAYTIPQMPNHPDQKYTIPKEDEA